MPFKEQKHVRTAVESIANNFSPQAQRLDIRKLPQAKQTTPYPGDGYYRGGKKKNPSERKHFFSILIIF